MKHEIKSKAKDFARLADGSKTFDIQSSREGYQAGDEITYFEYDDKPVNTTDDKIKKGLTGQSLDFKIGFVQIIDENSVVFSLLPIKKAKK